MTHVRRDRSGMQIRLQCDECRRLSSLWLIGQGLADLAAAREWLRPNCQATGWCLLSSIEGIQPVTKDLCRRCSRKLKRVL